ncbi:unnamed protein product [Acanthosepion pharaonis]|uniref:Uncharacterized protein n=1 Tax=Acanthosepion pharaonis TaxID=158019 RepID=A0A812AQQ3_ACAPH|nr:unnamed protein product [Sepia pharaonis]
MLYNANVFPFDLKDRPIRSALHPSRQPHSSIYFAANIEFLLTAMSQMAYPILPLIKQIRIVPRNKFTKEQHWASLISFWRQLTNVCKHVFPLNMLKEHSRCNRASCIYCGIERNSGPLIVRCNYLESPTNKGPSEQSKKKQVPSVEKTLVFNANYNVIKCICDGLNERPEYGWKKIAAHLNISLTHVNSCENYCHVFCL